MAAKPSLKKILSGIQHKEGERKTVSFLEMQKDNPSTLGTDEDRRLSTETNTPH